MTHKKLCNKENLMPISHGNLLYLIRLKKDYNDGTLFQSNFEDLKS